MGCKIRDLTGEKFGRLTPLYVDRERMNKEKLRKGRTMTYWICDCDCGNKTSVSSAHLIEVNTRSCGCIKRERMRTRPY